MATQEQPKRELRSLNSRHSTIVTFVNKVDVPVKLYWYNYAGEMKLYQTVEPGQSYAQQTFTTHPWTFFLVGGPSNPQEVVVAHKRVLFPTRGPMEVHLVRPDVIPFSIGSFRAFPEDFKTAVRALLLSWHRLHMDPTGGLLPAYALLNKRPRTRGFLRSLGMPTVDLTDHENLEASLRLARATTGLGDLPLDCLLEVIERMAPRVCYYEEAVDEEPDQTPAQAAMLAQQAQAAQAALGGNGGQGAAGGPLNAQN